MTGNTAKLKARLLRLMFVLGLLLGVGTWPFWLPQSLSSWIAAFETQPANQSAILYRIDELKQAIMEQRDILHVALGGRLPLRMSPEWEGRLRQLKNRLESAELWEMDRNAYRTFTEDVSELFSELTPFVEAEYFSQIEPLRWAVVALDTYHRPPGENDDFFQAAEEMRIVAGAAPNSARELAQRLQDRAGEYEENAESWLIQGLLQDAKRYLEAQDDDAGGIQDLHDSLSLYESHSVYGPEITELLERLNHKIARQSAHEMAEQWKSLDELMEDNPALYRTVTGFLLREVETARAVAALQGVDTSAYDELAAQMQDSEDKAREARRLGYQRWVLNNIKKFEANFSQTHERAEEQGWVFDDWTDELRREIQAAVIEYLLPIDLTLLDRPIFERYQREFERGWRQLDGQDEQTCIAIASAMMEKRNFRNFDRGAAAGISWEDNDQWKGEGCAQ